MVGGGNKWTSIGVVSQGEEGARADKALLVLRWIGKIDLNKLRRKEK